MCAFPELVQRIGQSSRCRSAMIVSTNVTTGAGNGTARKSRIAVVTLAVGACRWAGVRRVFSLMGKVYVAVEDDRRYG